ncbi:MAG: hypothetical protein L0387_22225 [Acidobacteria bacterium]|nr:hypothetical protein [Acidobacteriota bacterium]MCI0721617.1 hypothetical protein [Acidobacteriota bacterium]
MAGISKIIFWSYARGTLQYDIFCALILIFILVTPRQFFQDWTVISNPHQFAFGEQIVNTFDQHGNPVFNISAQLVPASQDASAVKNAVLTQLQKTLNKPVSIAAIKPILGENGETIGYSIWLRRENSSTF